MFPSLTPGVIHSVDREARIVRVTIPGMTDGAEAMPEAQLFYPLGDVSEHTEIRLQPGDRVWLAFVNGDPRFPVVVGYRPKESGNGTGWRRWRHDNVEVTADNLLRLNGQTLEINAHVVINGTVTNNGVNIGATHDHGGVSRGGARTDAAGA